MKFRWIPLFLPCPKHSIKVHIYIIILHRKNTFSLDEYDETTSEIAAVLSGETVVSDGLRAGWPVVLTLLTRDQYGHLVHVPNLKVLITSRESLNLVTFLWG